MCEFVAGVMRTHRLEPLITLTSISERCFDSTVPLLFDRGDPAAVDRAQRCAAELLEAGRREGFVPYRLGLGGMGWLGAHRLAHARLAARLIGAVDPDRVLAPGRYG